MKKFILACGILVSIPLLGACGNYQVLDTTYTYTKAIVMIGGEWEEIEVKSWRDYEGDQIQIIAKDGTPYLVHSVNCTLTK